jgi:hypothetical protein
MLERGSINPMLKLAFHHLLNRMTQEGDKTIRADLAKDFAEEVDELAGPNANPAERLLAEQAILDRWYLRHREMEFTANTDATISVMVYRCKVMESAHRRYLASLKALATIRKLSVNLSINVAQNQVNVSQ